MGTESARSRYMNEKCLVSLGGTALKMASESPVVVEIMMKQCCGVSFFRLLYICHACR